MGDKNLRDVDRIGQKIGPSEFRRAGLHIPYEMRILSKKNDLDVV